MNTQRIMVATALTLFACGNSSGTDSNNDSVVPAVMKENLVADLIEAGLSPDQAAIIAEAGAQVATRETHGDKPGGLLSRLFTTTKNKAPQQIPAFARGAIRGIQAADVAEPMRKRTAAVIVGAAIRTLDDIKVHIDEIPANDVIGAVARESIDEIGKGGFKPDEIPATIGQVAGKATSVLVRDPNPGPDVLINIREFAGATVRGLGQIDDAQIKKTGKIQSAGLIGGAMVRNLPPASRPVDHGEYSGAIARAAIRALPDAGITAKDPDLGAGIAEVTAKSIGALGNLNLSDNEFKSAAVRTSDESANSLLELSGANKQILLDNIPHIGSGTGLGVKSAVTKPNLTAQIVEASAKKIVDRIGIAFPEEVVTSAARKLGSGYRTAFMVTGTNTPQIESSIENGLTSGLQSLGLTPPSSYNFSNFDVGSVCPAGVEFNATTGGCIYQTAENLSTQSGGSACFQFDFDFAACQTQTSGNCQFNPASSFCNPVDFGNGTGCFGLAQLTCTGSSECEFQLTADLCTSNQDAAISETGCTSASEAGTCLAFSGCDWTSAGCSELYAACEDYNTEVSCASTPGCNWDGSACNSHSTIDACFGLEETICMNNSLCTWHAPASTSEGKCVAGSGSSSGGDGDGDGDSGPTGCAALTTTSECTNDSTCAWDAVNSECMDAGASGGCGYYTTEGGCNATTLCLWDASLLSCEINSSDTCIVYTTEADCITDANCGWDTSTLLCTSL